MQSGDRVLPRERGGSYRTSVLLEELLTEYDPPEFGRICQLLLGLTLKELGFKVPFCQLVGRPDLVAMRNSEGYRIEVKAPPGSEVTIRGDDLKGVKDASCYISVLAVLSYPEVKAKWIMANARKITPSRFDKLLLGKYSIKSFEKEVNRKFEEIVEKYSKDAMLGSKRLKRIFDGA